MTLMNQAIIRGLIGAATLGLYDYRGYLQKNPPDPVTGKRAAFEWTQCIFMMVTGFLIPFAATMGIDTNVAVPTTLPS